MKTFGRLVSFSLVVAWFVLLRPVALGGPAAYEIVSGHSMEPLLHTGDLVITKGASTYAVGDLIAFHVPAGQTGAGSVVIHRIVGGDGASGFVVKGDNKATPDTWQPKASDVIGRSWIALPGSGDVLLTLRRPIVVGALAAGVFAFWYLMSDVGVPRRRRKQRAAA